MDNTGNYVTYKELFDRMFPSTIVSHKRELTLSNKTGNDFDFVGEGFDMESGDFICQGDKIATLINVVGSKITLDNTTNFANGLAWVYRVTKSISDVDVQTLVAMQKIDLFTEMWFNKRIFDSNNQLSFEGNNTYLLHFRVPIIEIDSLKLNNDEQVLNPEVYHVFNSRAMPDDRRNPRVKLISLHDDIFKRNYSGIFRKGRFTRLEGSFGFLEQDGSTPSAIKWATAKMVLMEFTRVPEEQTSQTVKKEKTDMHEIEYETSASSKKDVSLSGQMTGDAELDRVLRMYKSPIAIGGSDPLYSAIIDFYNYRYDGILYGTT